MPPEVDDDRIAAVCRAFLQRNVKFVVIGGVAARLHETGHATVDIDVCPASDSENVERLALALADLGARLRVEGDPQGVPFDPHPDLLRQLATMTLVTDHGPVDLCFAPAGFVDGYQSLVKSSVTVVVSAVEVPVASLSDVAASKRAAGRPKDIVALPLLEAHLDDD